MLCASCGKENIDEAKSCARCGASLDPASPAPRDTLESRITNAAAGDDPPGGGAAQSLDGLKTIERATQAPSSEAPGQIIGGDYEILDRIGEGGMGVVYKALDRKLGRTVAVKRLRAPEDAARRGIERFLQEARAIAVLNHRSIVTVYGLGEDDKGPFIVMEYLGGGSLQDRIREKGRLELPEALDIAKAVGQALAYAHRRGIIHRDIKPSNILLAEDGTPKLVDFGLAQVAKESTLSMTGYGMGTLAYMAPEQRRDAKHSDHRTDVYAFAKTIYHMVTGEIPDAVDLDIVSAEIRPALKRALKPKPEDRPFSVEEFLRDLEHPAEIMAVPTAPGGPAVPGTCTHCGAANSTNVKFCKSCGAGLFQQCPKCGTEDRVGVKHCGSCGVYIGRHKEAQEALEQAQEHLKNRRYGRAAKEAARGIQTGYFGKELRKVQNDATERKARVDALRADALKLADEERFEEAEKPLREALELDPSQEDLSGLLVELRTRVLKRDVREALHEAREALKGNCFPVALERCAWVLEKDGDSEEARVLHAQAKQVEEDLEARLARVKELKAAYGFEEALKELEAIQEDYPWRDVTEEEILQCRTTVDGIASLALRAREVSEKRDLAGALKAWKKLLRVNPMDKEARAQVARTAGLIRARRRRRLRNSVIAVALPTLAGYLLWAAFDNRQHLAAARWHMESQQYDAARAELTRCGWFWVWGKAGLAGDLNAAEAESLRCQSDALAESGDFGQAAQLLEMAGRVMQSPGLFKDRVRELRREGVLPAKRDADTVAAEAAEAGAERDARPLWEEAHGLSTAAQEAFDRDEWDKAAALWGRAKVEYNKARDSARNRARYNQAMAAAQAALAKEDYEAAGREVAKALLIFPAGAEAGALSEKLVPTLLVTAELDGQACTGAQVFIDGVLQKDTTPVTFRLEKGRSHQFEVTLPAGDGKWYTKASKTVQVDRPGHQAFRATLETLVARVPKGFRLKAGTTAEPYTGTGWAKEVVHEATGIELVFIPAGRFLMGSPPPEKDRGDDETQHVVTLKKPFYLGKHEVTQGEWQKVMGSNPSHFMGDDRLPVEQVLSEDCQAFLQKAGDWLQLPAEVEWEYACRAGSASRFCYGDGDDGLGDYAWFGRNSGGKTHPVGGKKPNAWGLYDMHGNVWEWCADWYGDYPSGSVTDPMGPSSGASHVLRGGSWYGHPKACRSASRLTCAPDDRPIDVGFRVALDLE